MPAGPTESVWRLEPHTLAKHEILRRYLGAWFPIMSKWNRRIIFFDGFAGPGIYEGGEAGSPLIALQVLINHHLFASFGAGTEYQFLFCESDRRRFASLEQQLYDYKQQLGGRWPDNVRVQCTSDPFDETATGILDFLESRGSKLAPTFAFVDPFGVSGLPMELLARLVRSPKCELFINMIMNTAKRFATSGIIDRKLEELFGTDEYVNAEGLTGRRPDNVLARSLCRSAIRCSGHELRAIFRDGECRRPYQLLSLLCNARHRGPARDEGRDVAC